MYTACEKLYALCLFPPPLSLPLSLSSVNQLLPHSLNHFSLSPSPSLSHTHAHTHSLSLSHTHTHSFTHSLTHSHTHTISLPHTPFPLFSLCPSLHFFLPSSPLSLPTPQASLFPHRQAAQRIPWLQVPVWFIPVSPAWSSLQFALTLSPSDPPSYPREWKSLCVTGEMHTSCCNDSQYMHVYMYMCIHYRFCLHDMCNI